MKFNRNPGRPVLGASARMMVLCAVSLLTTLLVAACGGGGGGSSSTTTPPPATYAISGTVSGSVTTGVTVALSGSSTASTMTDSSGNYSFSGLANGSYTVTPSQTGASFTPASATVTVNGANNTGVNFVATVSYSISGTVSGNATSGVTVSLSGKSTASTTTDSAGNYSFTGLANGSYTVTPTKMGNAFTPASAAVPVNGANVTGTNFVAVLAYSISGTVTGPFVTGITMTLSGAASGTTSTSASGTYSFANLPAGQSYTVTPSLPGYIYAPTSATIFLDSDKTQNFAATPSNTEFSISGNVIYSGTKTCTPSPCRVYLSVNLSGGGSASAGTSIAGPGAYTIRGLPPGKYVVSARMDTIGTGARNASSPVGTSSVQTIVNSNLTNVGVALSDVTAVSAPTPTGLKVYPSKNAAAIFWTGPTDANGVEQATGYNISWGADGAATTGGVISVGATGGNDFYIQRGISSGGPYYYKIASVVAGAGDSAWSPIFGPIGITAPTGPNTVSGTISFLSGIATGPMYVGVYSQTYGLVFKTIDNPGSPLSYDLGGVASGTDWQVFATIDQNQNGLLDTGDVSNFGGGSGRLQSLITINTDPTNITNRALSAAGTQAVLRTEHYDDDTYGEQINVFRDSGTKLPVRVTVVSAAGAAVPFDVGDSNGDFQDEIYPVTGRPSVGDTASLQVTYSDGTLELLTPAVNVVLDSFARTLTTTPTLGSGTPTFHWLAPFNPPNPYSYTIWVKSPAGNTVWYYAGTAGDGMPKSQLSVVYNFDGSANPASLVTTTPYTWYLSVNDGTSNRAVATGTYIP